MSFLKTAMPYTISVIAAFAFFGTVRADDITLLDRESIFDRIEVIYPEVLEVPEVERREVALGIEGQMIQAGDVQLYVEQIGAEEGMPVLAVQGGPGTSHHYFHGYMDKLEAVSPVIYFDQRGVGLSEYKRPEGGYNIMQDVLDMEEMRKALGIDRWVLLGYSFGGLSSLLYAATFPERTAGVILLSSVVPFDVDEGLGERQYDFMSEAERARVTDFYSKDGQRIVPGHTDILTPDEQMVRVYNGYKNGDWKRRWMYKPPEDKFALFARYEWRHDKNYYPEMVQDGNRYDLRGLFNQSPIPMMILEGAWDIAFGSQKADLMASQLPEAELVYSHHAGHRVFEDDAQLFFASVHRFVEQDFTIDRLAMERWKEQLSHMLDAVYNSE